MKNLALTIAVSCVSLFGFAQNSPSSDLLITPEGISCNGKNDGKFTITNASQRTYSHQVLRMDDSPVLAEATSALVINDLSPGTYRVRSFYQNPDQTVVTFTSKPLVISDRSKIAIDQFLIVKLPDSEHQQGGIVELTLSGGTVPYSVTRVTPKGRTGPESFGNGLAQLTGIENTYYTFSVSDKNGCLEARRSEQIPLDAGISLNPAVHQPTCVNKKASVDFDIKGGTTPYTINYKNTTTGASFSESSSNGKASINIPDFGKYSFEIKDSGGPARIEKGFVQEFVAPGCVLTVDANPDTQPTTSNPKGGKAKVTTSGIAPFKVTISKSGGALTSTTSIESYADFNISGLDDGEYTVVVEDANLASGRDGFTIKTPVTAAGESYKKAMAAWKRFITTYAQVEIQRRGIKRTKNIVTLGWSALTGAATFLTSGTVAFVTAALNVTGNGINVFTNNKNYEALTKASQQLSEKLNPTFLSDQAYFDDNDWSKEKYTKLIMELDDLERSAAQIKLITDMPDLKTYPEKRLKKIPEYDKYK